MDRTAPARTVVVLVTAALAAAVWPSGLSNAGHAEAWILVCLSEPLEHRRPDDSYALHSGIAAVDDLIREVGIHRIESALPVSTNEPRRPEALARHGLDRTYRFFVPRGSDIYALAARFDAVSGVEFAEPDFIGQGGAVFPDDPRFSEQWGLDQVSDADVDAPEAWSVATGDGVLIAVLDTGIDLLHEDLAPRATPGFDFVNNDSDPSDDHDHGTNVSSIAAAATDNGLGIAGACWNCPIMPLKVLDDSNNGLYSWWADAMVYATDNGARVINLSAGGISPSQTLLNGVRYAYDAGVIHVSITHNDNLNLVRYPGAYPEVITVGATDAFDQRAVPFCYDASTGSNFGPEIDVVAPGELILGARRGGGYSEWCGTSHAAPLVAGLVGVMQTVNPSLGREEARHLIGAGAEDGLGRPAEDTPGFDVYHGWGRVNMDRTLQATAAGVSLRLEDNGATRLFHDLADPVASSYDFVRGDLASLAESAAGVSLGAVACIEDDSADADTLGDEDSTVPPVGEAFFYAGRAAAAPGFGSYGGSSRNRDRRPSSGDCSACGNGIRDGAEVCDGEDLGGETCQTQGFDSGTLACSATCDSLDTSGCRFFECGNSVCELAAGEDCLSCPQDCNGEQSGNPGNRYCCGDGDGENPVDCTDPRCSAQGNTCES